MSIIKSFDMRNQKCFALSDQEGDSGSHISHALDGHVLLVVHESHATLESLGLRLETAGAEVVMASSIAEALTALENFQFTSVIIEPIFLSVSANPLLERVSNLKIPYARLVSGPPSDDTSDTVRQIDFDATIDEIVSVLEHLHE
jgi:CheY-like chemotaxis protein